MSEITLDHLTMEQIATAREQIEKHYLRSNGEIDLMAMSKEANLFSTWRKLRDRERKLSRDHQ